MQKEVTVEQGKFQLQNLSSKENGKVPRFNLRYCLLLKYSSTYQQVKTQYYQC